MSRPWKPEIACGAVAVMQLAGTIGRKPVENKDIMSLREQEAVRKLLAKVEDLKDVSTSFSYKLNVVRLLEDHRKDWPA